MFTSNAGLSSVAAADLALAKPPANGGQDSRQKSKTAKLMPLPAGLIGLFLFSELFHYQALGLSTVTPDKVLFVIICGLFVSATLNKRLRTISLSRAEVCMALFALLCSISYCVTNPDAHLEHFKWLTSLANLIAYPFVVYCLVKRTRYDARQTRFLLWTIVCIGVYLALTASFEHFDRNYLIFPKYITDPHVGIQFGRARGPMVGSNPMGEWLILVYLATCLVMPYARKSMKVLLYGLILLVTVGIYFTLTRGVWLSFGVVLILTSVRGSRKFRIQSQLIVAVVALAFFAGLGSKFSFSGDTLFSRRQNTIDYRLQNNVTTFRMGMANFLTGVGYGSFFSNWKKYFDDKQKMEVKDLTDGNHNTYLGLFADLGFPGVALYVTLFMLLLKECIRVRKSLAVGEQFERHIALSSIGLLIVLLMEAMEGDLRFNPTLNTMTFLFVGITVSIRSSVLRLRNGNMMKTASDPADESLNRTLFTPHVAIPDTTR